MHTSTAIRRFGTAQDLEINFESADRPELVTALLSQCDAGGGDTQSWWSQSVGMRTAALLDLLTATEATSQLSLTARCMSPKCAATFAFDLPLSVLPAAERSGTTVQVSCSSGSTLTLRRPTGADLRHWRDAQPHSRADAVRLMLDTLLIEGEVRPEDEDALSAAMSSMDPLVDLSAVCECPECGATNEVSIDLEGIVLNHLRARQHALLHEVHRLATHYGWTEREILGIEPKRRARYLELIEGER